MTELLETVRLAALEGFSCSFQVWQHRHDAEPHICSISVHSCAQMIGYQHQKMTVEEAIMFIARMTDFAC